MVSKRRIAYLIPEFPGQTHIWMWREIVHLRERGMELDLFSTRPPKVELAARHAFAADARANTTYLWSHSVFTTLQALAWAAATRPGRLVRAIGSALALDETPLLQRLRSAALVAPGCVLAREVVRRGIVHVHVHSAGRSAVIAMMVKRLTGIEYSLTLNANLEWWGGGMAAKLGQARFTFTHTEWLFHDVREHYPHLRPSQVIRGGIGVDTQKWLPSERPHPGTSGFRLASVGRLSHGKGHDVTIRAIAQLRRAGRDVRLTIIGAGPERAALESLCYRLGVHEAVELSGSLSEDEVIGRLQGADAFVLVSRFEPLGVAYMEAMALGLPTVGTTAGGASEIITTEADGLLVPPEDVEAIAGALTRLMDDGELRKRLARNARATVVERFDSRIGAAILYDRLAEATGSREPGT